MQQRHLVDEYRTLVGQHRKVAASGLHRQVRAIHLDRNFPEFAVIFVDERHVSHFVIRLDILADFAEGCAEIVGIRDQETARIQRQSLESLLRVGVQTVARGFEDLHLVRRDRSFAAAFLLLAAGPRRRR